MGRKKKNREEQQKPWCFYCDREFIDEPTLVQHQKSKHFKCPDCNRKLNTAQGLSVHAYQVHKRAITEIPAALPGREDPGREIFGMAGVPEGARPGNPFGDEGPQKKAKLDAGSSGGVPGQQQQQQQQLGSPLAGSNGLIGPPLPAPLMPGSMAQLGPAPPPPAMSGPPGVLLGGSLGMPAMAPMGPGPGPRVPLGMPPPSLRGPPPLLIRPGPGPMGPMGPGGVMGPGPTQGPPLPPPRPLYGQGPGMYPPGGSGPPQGFNGPQLPHGPPGVLGPGPGVRVGPPMPPMGPGSGGPPPALHPGMGPPPGATILAAGPPGVRLPGAPLFPVEHQPSPAAAAGGLPHPLSAQLFPVALDSPAVSAAAAAPAGSMAAAGSTPFPPGQASLFPVLGGPAGAPPAAAVALPATGAVPAGAPAAAAAAGADALAPDVQLVYSDEIYSQEEKRALLPKYAAARRRGAGQPIAAGAGLQQHHLAPGIPQAVATGPAAR